MIKLKVKDIITLFDVKQDDRRHDISSVIGVVGEDLGAALFKRYYEKKFGKKVIISPYSPVSGTMKGPRLDRWIYVEESQNKYTAYQTEIKNWSAYAIGARTISNDIEIISATGLLNWKDRMIRLKHKDKNGENKVFYPMKKPLDFPNKAILEPLIIYWFVLSTNGKNTEIFFKANIKQNGFKKVNVFSMSNYLRSIKDRELVLDMPSAEKRIALLKKYFLVK